MSPRSPGSAGSKPRGWRSVISPAPTTSTATPPVSRSAAGIADDRNGDRPFTRRPRFRRDDERRRRGRRGSRNETVSVPGFVPPVGDRRARHLVDRDAGRRREHDLARDALHDFDAHARRDLARLLAERDELGDPRPRAQRHRRSPIVDLALPRERQRPSGRAVDRPPVLGVGFGLFGDEAAGDRQVDAGARHDQRHRGQRRRGRRQRHRLDAARRVDRHDDVEREDRAAGARDEHARRLAVDERRRASVEPRAADEQTGRHLHADPALLEHVDGEARLAGDGVAVDAQLVVDARQRGIDRRRQRVGGRRKRRRAARGIHRAPAPPSHPCAAGSCARAAAGAAAISSASRQSRRSAASLSPWSASAASSASPVGRDRSDVRRHVRENGRPRQSCAPAICRVMSVCCRLLSGAGTAIGSPGGAAIGAGRKEAAIQVGATSTFSRDPSSPSPCRSGGSNRAMTMDGHARAAGRRRLPF